MPSRARPPLRRHAAWSPRLVSGWNRSWALIAHHRLAGFFLLHRDILEMARAVAVRVRGQSAGRRLLPPGRGRGSSVGSIVCYLIGLSHVDPVETRLFLGRFLSKDLASVPDIDLDFPRDVREGLMLDVIERYGSEHAALVAAFPTYKTRGAIRDLGKALALPQGEVERMARLADSWGRIEPEQVEELRGRLDAPRWKAFSFLMEEIRGLPRHISQHSGGMVISTTPLVELVPVIPAAMQGRQICQWDKDSCADAGFLKIDLLGLGMLSAVEECVDLIAQSRGAPIDLSRVGFDDPDVFAEIRAADTVGVFQIESRAQMQSLVQTKPENLADLTVQVALVRPGPIVGDAVNPYIKHRRARRDDPFFEPPYDHPLLEPVLNDTLGVVVFQDQVLEVAIALAGFTTGEAESLRRAMSRKRSREALESHWIRFRDGAAENGVSEGDRAHRVRQGGRLLGVRVSQEPRRGLRDPGLPVGVAAPRLPGRVSVRAPERPADGFLPAGNPASRRRAARGRDPPARRQPEPRHVLGRGLTARRFGSGSATSKESAPGPSCWSPSATETATSPTWATWCGARRLHTDLLEGLVGPVPATASATAAGCCGSCGLHRAPAGPARGASAGAGRWMPPPPPSFGR